jgi:hypothetical protein
MNAWVRLTAGLQPTIVPSSVAKMKRLEPDVLPSLTTKSFGSPLKTLPVGVPPVVAPGAGMFTISGLPAGDGVPLPSYAVATPAVLSETHHGVVGPCEIPQGFFKLGSWTRAMFGRSETRLVWTKEPPASARASTALASRTTGSTTSATRMSRPLAFRRQT